ncbi:uncharacterized protein LOC121798279 isoform X1 [Salvia splendens]|uniref:uncharacterized protein LOC121798279 isoform X1 n=1 Tax=Salvia splendens TaxID=180675 RepID=UPI001C278F13|nr:uncharacterized protein LOC121798279 isoform X1 [Salvia splendens]
MEGGKQTSSSLASDLFGAKDSSSSSSSGIFGTMFPPPPKVVGQEYSGTEKKIISGNPNWTAKNGVADRNAVGGQNQRKDDVSYYTDEKVQPFHYSSSIYYGGQDVYSRPESAQNPGTSFNKDNGGEDDLGSASRGNWWQGSLYY